MWKILLFAFIEYVVIGIFITIDPYASKRNKRVKRLIKMLLWVLTAVITSYLMKTNNDYVIYLFVSFFFIIKYLLEIINPYFGNMFIYAIMFSAIGYALWHFFYEGHPIIVCAVILFVFYGTISIMKDEYLLMKKGMDADIEYAKSEEEKEKKKKRKKSLIKFVRLAYKAWRL